MNLPEQLDSFLTSESMAVVRLVKAEAERLKLPLYIVGGSVRDLLLGHVIKDLDFTVEGDAAILAEELLRKYAGRVVFHQRFGTATWTLDESTFKRVNIPLPGTSEFSPFLDLISANNWHPNTRIRMRPYNLLTRQKKRVFPLVTGGN